MSIPLPEHIVPISKERHLNKRLKALENHAFASGQHAVSIAIHEFSRCASIFPIVFLKDNEGVQMKPAVLLGLERGQNLFVVGGNWGALYVPAILRRYPFLSVVNEENKQLVICVDESSGLLNESEGSPLFTPEGEPTEYLEKAKRFLGELQAMDDFSTTFVEHLQQLELFRELKVSYEQQGEKKTLAGCYAVDEEKLQKLDDAAFLTLREKQYLGAIYSHLTSLGQLEKLSHLAARFSSKN